MFEFISDLNTEANSKLHFEEYLTCREDIRGSFSSSPEYWGLGFKIFITGFKKKKAYHVWACMYGHLISAIECLLSRMSSELNLADSDYIYD